MSKNITDQRERHAEHQQMLAEHKERKLERRERHRKGSHRFKILPITLV